MRQLNDTVTDSISLALFGLDLFFCSYPHYQHLLSVTLISTVV